MKMGKMPRFLMGSSKVSIQGAMPEECLNSLAKEGISFWHIQKINPLEIQIQIYAKDCKKAKLLALRAYCELSVLENKGIHHRAKKLKRRPILVLGMLMALFLSFFLQSFVWTVEVKGEDPRVDTKLRQILQEEGIGFGSIGRDIGSQKVKLTMISQMPELSWLAVNRKGGKLTVLYLLRPKHQRESTSNMAVNLVALRDGVITDFTVLEGMRLFQHGETVQKGQLLVSGFEDYGLCLKAVQAEGEIYAKTWRSGSLVSFSLSYKKRYTGKEWTKYDLIIGRKRINLCGNSGISTATCDKITDEYILSLPDYEFPLRLQVTTYREYTLIEEEKDPIEAQKALEQSWKREIGLQMIAGSILETESVFTHSGELYVLKARSVCHEMIAKAVPMEKIYEGENHE